MTALRDWILVSENEQPYINFESSLDDNQVVAGYVPVKSTLDVISFLKDATATQTSQGRAVICYGSYGSGKSRLCSVLARLFRDGFDSESLQPVWERLKARGNSDRLNALRQTMDPGNGAWRPWLVVSVYEAGQGETISNCLVNALFKAVKRAGLPDSVLGETIHRAAAARLAEMIENGADYSPPKESPYSSAEQLKRALEEDASDDALDVFRNFYRSKTFGTEFDEWVRNSGEIGTEAPEVFSTVAERIQQQGYEGIAVIWDEFGFFVEEMLRGAANGTRSLGREAMSLQNFIERACGSHQLGRKIVFLGFTHISLSEYGSREGLEDADNNRLSTVADRFRDPSIPIQLSVTEKEGYHLLSGMINRTEAGQQIFANPIPKLQRLAERMNEHSLWKNLGTVKEHYDEIVAPCYPLHPATSSALLLLSDQVAQRARTTFYYLQNKDNGGLAAKLNERSVNDVIDIGSQELIRINDIFPFFKEAIHETKRTLLEWYEEAVARFPAANDFEIKVLQTTLVLSVIATPTMAPTTNFLSLCLCDCSETEAGATPLHEALKRLSDASSLWKNDATDVWQFVGGQGVTAGLEDDLEQEKAIIPTTKGVAELLHDSIDLQREIIDLIGDFDLDPAESGVVRRVGIHLLPTGDSNFEHLLKSHPVNPAKNSCKESWRSARVFLLATDKDAELLRWRQSISKIDSSSYYFLVPEHHLRIDRELVRDLIAHKNLLEKTSPGTHIHEVLEARLTKKRTDLKTEFGKSFGNAGLTTGTTEVIRSGATETTLPITSWSELLPAIATDLNNLFTSQIYVRCGTFNEWTNKGFNTIEKIVKRILGFDRETDWQTEFLNFPPGSQEAAIIDGVLVENNWFNEDELSQEWTLKKVNTETSSKALLEVHHFLTRGTGAKEIGKLFGKLIDRPFGIPNGIIPILIALVVRTEASKIVFYSGSNNRRVTDSELPKAIADMAKQPAEYHARYNKLSPKQRNVFFAIGPKLGVEFSDKELSGDAFYEKADEVRSKIRDWIVGFPDVAGQSKSLNDSQRNLTKILRQPIPPQMSVLADCLVDLFNENIAASDELKRAGTKTTAFPLTSKCWEDYREAIERHVDGIRAPVQKIIREIVGPKGAGVDGVSTSVKEAIRLAGNSLGKDSIINKASTALDEMGRSKNSTEEIIGAITNKRPEALTEEDYGKAQALLEVAAAHKDKQQLRFNLQEFEVIQPDGNRACFGRVENLEATQWLKSKFEEFIDCFSLDVPAAKSLVIELMCNTDISKEQADGTMLDIPTNNESESLDADQDSAAKL